MDPELELLVMGDGPGAAEALAGAGAAGVRAARVIPRDVAGEGTWDPGWPWPFTAAPPAPAGAGAAASAADAAGGITAIAAAGGALRAFLAGEGAVFVEGADGLARWRPRRIVLAPRLRPARPSWWKAPATVAAPPARGAARRVLVVGGGHTGVEAAAGWLAAGHEVVLVEAAGRLLPTWDADLAEAAREALQARGAVVQAGVRAIACEATAAGARVVLRAGAGEPDRAVEGDIVVPALGWRPALGGCGLERTRALVDRHGFLEADARFQTPEPFLHAIGAALALPLSPFAAARQAQVVVGVAAGADPSPLRHAQVPRVVAGPVPLLAAGLSLAAAGARGFRALSGRADAADGTWARCVGDLESGAVLGVQAAGPGAAALAGGAGAILAGAVAGAGALPHLPPLLLEACAAAGCTRALHG